MIPYICAHTRSGTHYLAALLQRNFGCGEDYSHTRVCPEPFVHLYRPILPVMLSIWNVREHLGIAAAVAFADMLRTKWKDMPRSESGNAYLDGVRNDAVCTTKVFDDETLPERWVRIVRAFDAECALTLSYYLVVEAPHAALRRIAHVFHLPFDGSFTPVVQRVGWAAGAESPHISSADITLLQEFQDASRFSSPW